jgi:rhodanese-related sulfurtransferase
MKKLLLRASVVLLLVVVLGMAGAPVAASPVGAGAPFIPITPDQAFDAVTSGVDPMTGAETTIALVDVRDPMEIFWSGAPAAVDRVLLANDTTIEPDWGKVRLIDEGKFVEYRVGGEYRRTLVTAVDTVEMHQIAVNVPLWFWSTEGPVINTDTFAIFVSKMVGLANTYDVLILFCRTGGRAQMAARMVAPFFEAIYVIDDPVGNMVGGFSGMNYENVYNGYVGFPGRQTDVQAKPSASWMDAGLPIVTMVPPITP